MPIVAIAGASGVVGTRALHHLLASPDVERLYAFNRRPLPFHYQKLTCETVNFGDPATVQSAMPSNVGVAICCLGTTMKKAGSQAAFRAVDLLAVVTFAEAALSHGAQRFLLVSSLRANPRSGAFYLRIKGEAEAAVQALGFPQLTILRPSLIDDKGARIAPSLSERLLVPMTRAVFSVLGKRRRYAPISADTIARALVRLSFDETSDSVRILNSERLHALGS